MSENQSVEIKDETNTEEKENQDVESSPKRRRMNPETFYFLLKKVEYMEKHFNECIQDFKFRLAYIAKEYEK